MSPGDLIRAASGPVLLLRLEDVPAIRSKVESHQWARRAYRKLVDAAQSRLANPVKIPDRGGQWPHWYACQECGSQLVTESPTIHRCPSCGLVNSGEPWDSVPLTRVHNALSEDVRKLGVSYALTGDRPFAEKAAEILLGYAEAYPKYPVRDHHLKTDTDWATKVSWGTLGESVWLIPVCCGYDLIRHANVLRPAEHQAIREQLLRPAAQLILKHNIGIHNIQCWHNCAIGMAALVLRDAELLEFAVQGEVGIVEQIEQGIREDGQWFEGSWGYHFYGMTPLVAWAVALRNCGLDLFTDRVRRMFTAPLKAVRPDGGMPAFHDSGGGPLANQAHHYEVAFSVFEDPELVIPFADSSRDSLGALIHGSPELPDPSVSVSSESLPDSGFAFLRQGSAKQPTYVALDYGPHGGGHGHPDKLGFTLFARGTTQAPDPGSVAYGIPIHQQWYKQTVSHNTIVVDGQSQQPATGQLEFLVRADGLDVVQADAGPVYDGVQVIRTMLVASDTVLIVDRVRSEHSHTFDWAYHNRGVLRPGFSHRRLKKPLEAAAGYEVVEDLRRGRPEGTWQSTWRQEGSGVRLTLVGSRRDTLVYTGVGPANVDGPGIGFAGEDVPFVLARREGRRRTTFAAAIQAFGSRPAKDEFEKITLSQPERGRGYRYRRGQTDLTVILPFQRGALAYNAGKFRGGGLVLDAREERAILCSGSLLVWVDLEVTVDPIGSVELTRDASGIRVTNLSDHAVELTLNGRATSLPAGRRWRIPTVE